MKVNVNTPVGCVSKNFKIVSYTTMVSLYINASSLLSIFPSLMSLLSMRCVLAFAIAKPPFYQY